MEQHTCVRNPDTGLCYVCQLPMRKNFGVRSLLEVAIDATEAPRYTPPAHVCACGTPVKPPETQCGECWLKSQEPPPFKPAAAKPVKQTKPAPAAPGSITLDSILDAMETNPNKWN